MVVNDWVLKPSTWVPGLLSGKLSDFAGLLFFPLLLSALFDCALLLLSRCGLRVDFSLRRYKLLASNLLVGLCFTLTKLLPSAAEFLVELAALAGLNYSIAPDPSDLMALPVLWISWRQGCREIARLPLGRLEFLVKRDAPVGNELDDLVVCGAPPELVSELRAALDSWLQDASPDSAQNLEKSIKALRGG